MTHSRRELLTAAGAGAAAGLVWTAPRIEGLSLRPRYASAASGTCETFSVDIFNQGSTGGGTYPFMGTGTFSASTAGDPNQLHFEIRWRPSLGGNWDGPTFSASSFSGASCTFAVGPNGIPNPAGTAPPADFTITGEVCCP